MVHSKRTPNSKSIARWLVIVALAVAPSLPVCVWLYFNWQPPRRMDSNFKPSFHEYYLQPRLKPSREIPKDVERLFTTRYRDAVWKVFQENDKGRKTLAGLREAFGKSGLQTRLKWDWAGTGLAPRSYSGLHCFDARVSSPSWWIQVPELNVPISELHDYLLGEDVPEIDGNRPMPKVNLVIHD